MSVEQVRHDARVAKAAKPYKGMAMEGLIAKWYTKVRAQDEDLARAVQQVKAALPEGGSVLEVAPGPGYLAIELAKQADLDVIGLDISRTFVEIAQAKAQEAGVTVDFQQGNASDMPFADNTFDFIICRAAFKNFSEPVQAIREIYRVLKSGGKAVIHDLRRDASPEQINAHVGTLGLGPINARLTKFVFHTTLLRNAYTGEEIRQMVAQTEFDTCEIDEDAVGMEIWLAR